MPPDAASAPLKHPDPGALAVRYNKERDVLIMTVSTLGPAVSLDVDGEFWVRVVPEAREVVGVEIEDFERVFLKNHPEVVADWQKPGRQVRANRGTIQQSQQLTRHVMGLLEHILATRPGALAPSE